MRSHLEIATADTLWILQTQSVDLWKIIESYNLYVEANTLVAQSNHTTAISEEAQ